MSSAGDSKTADQGRGLVTRVNANGRAPMVFIHGLCLLPNSWDGWAATFE